MGQGDTLPEVVLRKVISETDLDADAFINVLIVAPVIWD